MQDCASGPATIPKVASELQTVGKRLRAARDAQAKAYEAARLAALASLADGVSESQVATDLGVDRMTVRKWQGKR